MILHFFQVKLAIWDTAGQERFRTLTPSYYRGGQVSIFYISIRGWSPKFATGLNVIIGIHQKIYE